MTGVAPASASFVEAETETAADDEAEEADMVEVDEAENEAEAGEETEAEEDEAEAEEDAEEEADEEEASEEEGEDEDAALIEIGEGETASDESDESEETEWTTPAYADAEQAPAPIALIEDESEDYQTPQYIDGVYHTVEGEETATEDEQTEADAGTTDVAETSFFESEGLLSRAANEGEWAEPEYSGEPAAAHVETVEAELTALLQTAETLIAADSEHNDAEWTTPTYDDAKTSSGAKEYARIIPSAEEPALIEAESEQTQQTEVKTFTPIYIRSRTGRLGGRFPLRAPATINRFRSAGADLYHTARRYRAGDSIVPRPRWNRHDPHSPRHAAMRKIAGSALRSAEHNAYDRLEGYCSNRLPESFAKFCRPVLRRFRRITEGLSYGDRIPQVCMSVNLCKQDSYTVASPHDRLEERTF